MDFLANENFPLDAVEILRGVGHDVVWIRTESPGLDDRQVLAWAMRDRRVLLTCDKDFGELAFHAGLPAECGVILFRLSVASSADMAAAVLGSIQARHDWAGQFSVVEPGRIRMRPLPSQLPPNTAQDP